VAGTRVLSAGVVVVREHPEEGIRFLMLRAYRNWDFPKGEVGPDETPLAAAIRETLEETSIDDLDFAWGEDYIETGPYARNKIARYYLARTRMDAVNFKLNPVLGRPEHHEYRWVGVLEAIELASPRLQPVMAWAARLVSATLDTDIPTPPLAASPDHPPGRRDD
jgi:8-oxo-dGTP pyrophosphatase MutT (NUDIX family)